MERAERIGRREEKNRLKAERKRQRQERRAERRQRRSNMTERPLLGKIICFSLPLMATGILQLLYNAADIIVVGQFSGHVAMGAVGATSSLVNLLVNLFVGLSVGALANMSRWVGAGDEKRADAVVHTSVPVSLIGGVVIGAVGVFASPWLLELMQTPENVLPLSSLYMRIYFLGMPVLILYNFGASILRACGDTKRPLIILCISGMINVALNCTFVAGFGMSVDGVAIATVVSEVFSALAVLFVLIRRKGFGHLSFRRVRIDREALGDMIRIGLPAGIQGTIFSLSNVVIQSSVNSFGDIAVAGNTAAASIEGFVYTSMNAVSQACLTFTAQNFGAQKTGNMRLVLRQCLIIVFVLGAVMGAVVMLLATPLLSIYNREPEVIAYGINRMTFIVTTYFLCGIMEVLVGALRGMGRSVVPMAASIIGVCGLRILWIYTVFAADRNLDMLYISYPISWLVTCLFHLVCYFVVRHKVERQIRNDLRLEEAAGMCQKGEN